METEGFGRIVVLEGVRILGVAAFESTVRVELEPKSPAGRGWVLPIELLEAELESVELWLELERKLVVLCEAASLDTEDRVLDVLDL